MGTVNKGKGLRGVPLLLTVLAGACSGALAGTRKPPEILPKPCFENCLFLEMFPGEVAGQEAIERERRAYRELMGPQRLYVRTGMSPAAGGTTTDGAGLERLEFAKEGMLYGQFSDVIAGTRAAYRELVRKDMRYASWQHTGEWIFKPAGDPPYKTMSRYADAYWPLFLQDVRRAGESFRKRLEKGAPMSILAIPNELCYDIYTQNGQGYEPFMVAQFRDWLAHRGRYAKGGPYEGEGRPGGEGFSDDPTPDKAKGKNRSFNVTFGTAFKTWELKYWDLDRFPDPLPEGSRALPGKGEKGHTPGGFDAPRDAKDPLFPYWQRLDIRHPGFRQLALHQALTLIQRTLREECGIPKERIFTRGWGYASYRKHETFHAGTGSLRAIVPAWLCATPYGCPGWNLYAGASPGRIDGIREALEESGQGLWAATEYHPFFTDPLRHTAGEYAADLKRLWEGCPVAPRFIGFSMWFGGQVEFKGRCQIQGTPFVPAIREFYRKIPDVPYPFRQEPAKPYAPPPVRGLTVRKVEGGRLDLQWEERIWEGDVVRWKDWESFQEFEVAACDELFPQEIPSNPHPRGKTASASYQVPQGQAGAFLCVRAVSKDKLKGEWAVLPIGAPE